MNRGDDIDDMSPFNIVTCKSHEDQTSWCKIFSLFMKLGLDPNFINVNGVPQFMDSIEQMVEYPFLLDWFLEAGADTNLSRKDGFSGLHLAVCTYGAHAVKTLLQTNIDVAKVTEQQVLAYARCRTTLSLTPVQYSIMNYKPSLTKFLVRAGFSTKYVLPWLEGCDDYLVGLLRSPDNQELVPWLRQRHGILPSLKVMCRSAIMRNVGHIRVIEKIGQLPLPQKLKTFLEPLNFLTVNEDIDGEKYEHDDIDYFKYRRT